MAFLERLSDTFWSYISPSKTNATKTATATPTPQTVARAKRKPGRPPKRKASLDDVDTRSKPMSPVERVDSWRADSAYVSTGRKRKAPMTPSTGAGRRKKVLRVEEGDVGMNEEDSEGSELSADDGAHIKQEGRATVGNYEEEDEDEASVPNIRALAKSQSPHDDDPELDTTIVVSEEEYTRDTSPRSKKILSPTKAAFDRGVSTEELREQGWDDEHIVLVQKIAMRGFEPLLPGYYKFNWSWMPDALFCSDKDEKEEAFVSSVRGEHYRGIMALERLFELGGRVRDRIVLKKKAKGKVEPEEQTRRMLREFMKWAEQNSGLDPKKAIPLLVLECKPSTVDVAVLQDNAKRKLEKLATRYRNAFRVSESIESSSPTRSNATTLLCHPIPTLYAFIASHTLIALVAYNPEDEDPELKSIAFFDMKDKNYDVWNALALAITVCHVRNVQMGIAEETGVGLKDICAGDEGAKEAYDDPDL
ncbi:hypothetical protein LTR37_003400 [Vermiconidia calcicola]|uniref:Uncharacterized protein n=1 Tax=Vermiconidia calcicola TaxID=1690605 RepID=A0ACC3NQ64_9PEZI|nr:hypothetical protein LTR37_003400 [Vermiconidia calcicola]